MRRAIDDVTSATRRVAALSSAACLTTGLPAPAALVGGGGGVFGALVDRVPAAPVVRGVPGAAARPRGTATRHGRSGLLVERRPGTRGTVRETQGTSAGDRRPLRRLIASGTKKPRSTRGFSIRVSEGTRTPDRLDHNQELYQLSYAHRAEHRIGQAGREGRARVTDRRGRVQRSQ